MKINTKESNRTLHTMPEKGGIILRERTKSSVMMRGWDEQRVFISFEEIERLFANLSRLKAETEAV